MNVQKELMGYFSQSSAPLNTCHLISNLFDIICYMDNKRNSYHTLVTVPTHKLSYFYI